jgi:O-antigen chain-terminating methyltransferase
MQRTIEKIAQERRDLEERFQSQLEGLRAVARSFEEVIDWVEVSARRLEGEHHTALGEMLSKTASGAWDLARSAASLAETAAALAEARDKEWDILGNNHLGMVLKSLEARIDRLAAAYDDVTGLAKTFVLLQDRLGRLQTSLEGNTPPSAEDVRAVLEPLRDWRYTRFENRFRGGPEELRRQQERYLARFKPGGAILDLGCGRGEFLELLRRNGFQGAGADLNAQMVGLCRDKGLRVEKADALEALAKTPNGSLDGIFSSQVIEHLPPGVLERLIEAARTKLAPGGTIILETVNPASVFALVRIFFLDPTHRMPVHPLTLQFLLETAGFENVEIEYSGSLDDEKLHHFPDGAAGAADLNLNVDRLNALLFGPPNYAAIGRKG